MGNKVWVVVVVFVVVVFSLIARTSTCKPGALPLSQNKFD